MKQATANLVDGKEELNLGEGSVVRFQTFLDSGGYPRNIEIAIGKESKMFPGLAWLELEPGNSPDPRFTPKLTYIFRNNGKPFLAVVGRYSIICAVGERSLSTILELNRKETDDQGFYSVKILLREDGFLFVYEGGAARITDRGSLVWHVPLYWDDTFERADEKLLYYSTDTETGLEKWALSVVNGDRVRLEQSR
jgi:hypothetical protein